MRFAKVVFRVAGIWGLLVINRPERPSAHHSPWILLRFRGRRVGLANRVPLYRHGPRALSAPHDPFDS